MSESMLCILRTCAGAHVYMFSASETSGSSVINEEAVRALERFIVGDRRTRDTYLQQVVKTMKVW
jgi:hypothetical protein